MTEIAVFFVLLALVAALGTLANRLRVPYPVLLVLGGLILAFIPGVPRLELEPEVVFLLFLPPLLFGAAYNTSWRDFRADARAISLLAIGLVLVTMMIVATVAHYLAGLPWAAAFVLGAVVSPTDAVAATAIAQRLGIPRRIVTILEGESLVNDATGIVAYRVAVAVAAGTVTFSPLGAGAQFTVSLVGGVLVGAAVGWLAVRVLSSLDDSPVEIAVSLLVPFLAYITAEEGPNMLWHGLLGLSGEPYFSGVLAAVAAGLYVGRNSSTALTRASRLEGRAVWDMVSFLLNGLAFILIGLQLPEVTSGLEAFTLAELVRYGALVSPAVILVRVIWVFPATYGPRLLSRGLRERDPFPSWRNVLVVAWAGMRGVVSLAAALSLPLESATGRPFPGRDLVLFLTFCVILATLVIQGLSLPLLIRLLGLEADSSLEKEEVRARIETAEAALGRLEALEAEPWVHPDTVKRVRGAYTFRRDRFLAREGYGAEETPENDPDARSSAYQRLIHELAQAQRQTLIRLRDEDRISDEVLRRVERDLDLEELRLDS